MRRTKKATDDYYPSPAGIVRPLAGYLKQTDNAAIATILEPCSGTGELVTQLTDAFPESRIITNEPHQPTATPDYSLDMTCFENWRTIAEKGDIDAVITNPPFSLFYYFLVGGLNYARMTALLLPLTYLEPTKKRQKVHQLTMSYLRCVIPLSPRPKYGHAGSPSGTCVWAIYGKQLTTASPLFNYSLGINWND